MPQRTAAARRAFARLLRRSAPPLALLAALTPGCGEGAWTLPEVAASSKYIDYGTWADTTNLCMDDRLAAWDRFIEKVADTLGVPPPTTRIRYTWVPRELDASERWGCDARLQGCYVAEDHAVFSRDFEHLHELVHAIELPALGSLHPILTEGMATYLGDSANTSTEGLRDTFPQEFWEMLHAGPPYDRYDYSLAKHFVGSIVARHGMSRYREFRQRLDHQSTPDEFIETYESVFQEGFLDALESMTAAPVLGQWIPWACDDSFETEIVPWTAPGQLQAVLQGECGDPHFFAAGSAIAMGSPFAVGKEFRVHIDQPGRYRLRVHSDAPAAVWLENCPGTEFGRLIVQGKDSFSGFLYPGPHFLQLLFAPGTNPESSVPIDLVLEHPLPP